MMRLKTRTYDLIFLVSVVSIFCFLLWKCPYGFGNIDESFYLTIPWRLAQGDGLFLEEWHLSQMSGFLLLPFVAIYRAISPAAEGLILTFRYLCITIQALCCSWYYHRLKRISPIGALAASIFAMIYIPFNITALSYNSMGIFLMGLSAVTLATIGNTPFVRVELLFSGLAFAGAVLCCPYLIVVYAVFFIGFLAYIWLGFLVHPAGHESSLTKDKTPTIKKKSLSSRQKDLLRGFFWFSAGAALLALVFAIFVLSRASISDIAKAFPQIMNDPQHKHIPFFRKLYFYGRSIVRSSSWSSKVLIILGVLLAAAIVDKKRKAHRSVYIALALAAVEMMLISIDMIWKYINCLMYPVHLLSIFCLLLTNSRYSRRLFWAVVMPGLLYSVCIHFTSNQYFYVISSASTVSMLGSVTMLAVLIKEIVNEEACTMDGTKNTEAAFSLTDSNKKSFFTASRHLLRRAVPVYFSIALLLTLSGLLIYRRATGVFWESSIDTLTQQLDYGPEAGVMATPGKEKLYDRLMDAATYIDENTSAESVLFLSEQTWMYLACPKLRNSSYSAWLSGINNDSLNRLMAYYKLNPGKLPDVIFADKNDEEYADILAEKLRYENKTYIPTGGCIYSKALTVQSTP